MFFPFIKRVVFVVFNQRSEWLAEQHTCLPLRKFNLSHFNIWVTAVVDDKVCAFINCLSFDLEDVPAGHDVYEFGIPSVIAFEVFNIIQLVFRLFVIFPVFFLSGFLIRVQLFGQQKLHFQIPLMIASASLSLLLFFSPHSWSFWDWLDHVLVILLDAVVKPSGFLHIELEVDGIFLIWLHMNEVVVGEIIMLLSLWSNPANRKQVHEILLVNNEVSFECKFVVTLYSALFIEIVHLFVEHAHFPCPTVFQCASNRNIPFLIFQLFLPCYFRNIYYLVSCGVRNQTRFEDLLWVFSF